MASLVKLRARALLAAKTAKAALETLAEAMAGRVLAAQVLLLLLPGGGASIGARRETDGDALAAQALGHERVALHLEHVVILALGLLQVALNRVRGLTLALEVVGVVLDELVAFVGATGGVGLAHQVGALFVGHDVAAGVEGAAGDAGGALQRAVVGERILDKLLWRRAQSGHVGVADRLDGRVHLVDVAAGEGSVVRAAVVVGRADVVEQVDGVGLGEALAVAAVRGAGVTLDHVERAMRHVAGITLVQKAVAVAVGAGWALKQLRWLAVTATPGVFRMAGGKRPRRGAGAGTSGADGDAAVVVGGRR